MKNEILIFLFNLLIISTIASNKNENCIDQTLIGDIESCIEIYDPVCGCDGNTYDNYCVAERSGVTSYCTGACD